MLAKGILMAVKDKQVLKAYYRSNVRDFVDSDYKSTLSDEIKEYLCKFENEYYANALGRDDSIHQKSLSLEKFHKLKKETYSAANAQNRDAMAIAGNSKHMEWIDSNDCFIQLEGKKTDIQKLINPSTAMKTLIQEAVDELRSSASRNIEVVLEELAYQSAKIAVKLTNSQISKAHNRKHANYKNKQARKEKLSIKKPA